MGWRPDDVDRASMWQYVAALEAYNRANGPAEKGLKAADQQRLAAMLEQFS